MSTKLQNLAIDEISGVDLPANLINGWLIAKARESRNDFTPIEVMEAVDKLLIAEGATNEIRAAVAEAMVERAVEMATVSKAARKAPEGITVHDLGSGGFWVIADSWVETLRKDGGDDAVVAHFEEELRALGVGR
jgi:hypothetical protein